MTDALERAARAIRQFYVGGVYNDQGHSESAYIGDSDAMARAAILAFLAAAVAEAKESEVEEYNG